MSRYIEADAYRAKWADIFDSAYGDNCCEMFKKSIDEQPTADVVEVVRCKDCEWWKSIFSWNGKEHKVCVRDSSEPSREQNDFCSYGQRKEADMRGNTDEHTN